MKIKDYWTLHKEEKIAKKLLKSFTGVSIREQNSINLVKHHFGIIPEFVLDPTLLIDKKYYLDLVRNYPKFEIINENYIFVYDLSLRKKLKLLSLKASNELNYKIYEFILNNTNPLEDFIYYIANCKGVLTNAYHGTLFSIIFNKPFIYFYNKNYDERFESLGSIFDLKNRFNSYEVFGSNFTLLKKPLKLNTSLIRSLKIKSINFIKKNLDLI